MLTQAQYESAAADLAASIETPLIAAIDAQRDEILAGVGFFYRWVAVRMWSAVLAAVPVLARVALEALLDRFSATTVGQVADLLYAHKARLESQAPKDSTP